MADRQGRDVVVSSDRLKALGIELGLIEKIVLESAEAELAKSVLVATTPTFALFRGAAVMAVGGQHHEVELFYALLADPERGSLRVAVWSHDLQAARPGPPARLIQLPPNLAFDCRLHVRAARLLGAVPVSWSFAMQDLPPGRVRAVTADLATLLASAEAGRPEPLALEQGFRRALSPADAPRPASGVSTAPAGVAGPGPVRSARTSTAGSARPGTTPLARCPPRAAPRRARPRARAAG
jgi:hypothetical protein